MDTTKPLELTIWKYPIFLKEEQTITIPEYHRVLSFHEMPNGLFCIWALVASDSKQVEKKIYIRGTGAKCGDEINYASFVGTIVASSGFVWHLFAEY